MCQPRFLALVVVSLLAAAAHAQDGWYSFRGNAQRTGMAANLPAWEKRQAWQRPLLMDHHDILGQAAVDPDGPAKDLLDKLRKGADPTILPPFFPLVVNQSCIYRSFRDVRSVTLHDAELKDDFTKRTLKLRSSDFMWKGIFMNTSLADLLKKARMARIVDLLTAQKQQHLVWANTTIGSPSSDGKSAFAIDDFAFPTIDAKAPLSNQFPGLRPYIRGNRLNAYDVISGKLVWSTDLEFPDGIPPFDGTYFLGSPWVFGRHLFVLNEKDADLHLVRIDLERKVWKRPGQAEIDKALALAKIPAAEQVRNHVMRRAQALHLAHHDGLLVCPTNAGVLVGVDRAKMAVRWTYRYRDANAASPAHPHWQAAGPIIHQQRIVFTAADAPGVHCLGLDGKKQWTAAADDELNLATVHDDLVVLVGKGHCRAIGLADGKPRWKIATGLPAGVGVKDGTLYYLPLKRADGSTIWAIDLAKGIKAGAIKMPYPDALGNLILHRGMFVSQSATHIAAFPLPARKP